MGRSTCIAFACAVFLLHARVVRLVKKPGFSTRPRVRAKPVGRVLEESRNSAFRGLSAQREAERRESCGLRWVETCAVNLSHSAHVRSTACLSFVATSESSQGAKRALLRLGDQLGDLGVWPHGLDEENLLGVEIHAVGLMQFLAAFDEDVI
jgi:hypothetical protein